jgi:hypothetical protein
MMLHHRPILLLGRNELLFLGRSEQEGWNKAKHHGRNVFSSAAAPPSCIRFRCGTIHGLPPFVFDQRQQQRALNQQPQKAHFLCNPEHHDGSGQPTHARFDPIQPIMAAYTVERVMYLDAPGRRVVLVAVPGPVPAVAGAAVVDPEGRRYARLQVPGAGRLLVVAGFLEYDGEALGRRWVLHVPLPELGQRPPRLVLQFSAKRWRCVRRGGRKCMRPIDDLVRRTGRKKNENRQGRVGEGYRRRHGRGRTDATPGRRGR